MKRFLTCALCFVSLPAIAVPLYYEQDGACPGLYSSQPLTGCNATTVSKLNVTPINGTVFNGFFINGRKVVNADGTFTNNALDILRGADLTSGAEIPQTYTCSNGVTETGYGECQSGTPLVTVKLDTRGGSMAAPTQVKVAHGGTLTAYAPDRSSFDGAIFVGWAKSGQPDSSAAKNAVVNDTVGTTVTYRAVYTCPGGRDMNQYNVCVSDEDEYLTPDGNPVQPNELHCWRPTGPNGTYENYCHWNLLVTFHDNNDNPGYNFSVTYPYTGNPVGNNNKTLTCYGGTGCRSASWCKENNSSVHNGTCMSLWVPTATNYEFRGYFRQPKNPEDLITLVGTTDGGAFNVFYRTNQNNAYMNITGHAVVVVEPSTPVELDCVSVGNSVGWTYDENGNRYCDGNLVDNTTWPIDIYGGWARKCATSTQQNPFSCDLIIGDHFTPVNGFGKGDVKYETSCAAGYALNGDGNRYDPQCVREAGSTLDLTYQFVDQHGLPVDGCNIDTYESCTTSDTYYLPHQAVCGTNNQLKYLSTYSGLYTPGHSVSCSSNVFGNTGSRIVTGYVCRNSCAIGQSVPNGTCTAAYRPGGRLNGNEYVENIYEGCNQISCDTGYMPGWVNNSVTCVPKCEFGHYCTVEACNEIGGECDSNSQIGDVCKCLENTSGGGGTCTPGRYCSTETDCTNIGGICTAVNSNGCLCYVASCSFGTSCLVATCNSIGGECQSTNGSTCICVQPGTGNDDEPEWVSVEFRYGNVTLTSPASPTTFYLDKKRKCYYAYTQPVSKDNCGLNSPYRLQYITIPTAQGKTFAGFWREGQSLKIIDTDGKVRATNQGIDQLTFNSSATATVMYLTAHWN